MLSQSKKWLLQKTLRTGWFSDQPTNLNIFTTNRCNFSCFYCSRNIEDFSPDAEYRYDDKSEFHTANLVTLLDKYPKIQSVSFVGIGEPFLIKDLFPMARLAKERGKKTLVISNGSLLHRHWGNIGECFDNVSISLHGLNATEIMSIAKVKERTFNQFVENLRQLTQVEVMQHPRLRVSASVVLLKHNLDRVRRAAALCAEVGIQELDLQNYLALGSDAVKNVIFDDELEYIDFTHNLVAEYAGRLKINRPVWIRRNESKMGWGCVSFYRYLRVDGLGNVSGCGRIMPPTAENGNFLKEEDVFSNTYFKSMQMAFRNGEGIPACCRHCPDAQ
jgi:wyosine [tRNA(Phe)-imidazoG37] synthetase (radical SAM superfamily)